MTSTLDHGVDTVVHHIGGRAAGPAATGVDHVTLHDPATGVPFARFPRNDTAAAAAAVVAARDAQPWWQAAGVDARADLLLRAADRLAAAAHDLARLDMIETGKPHALAMSLAAAAEIHAREFVAVGRDHFDRALPGGHRQLRDPHGVAVIVVPWNAPVEIVMRTLPAILLAGSTVVIKPSERAPLAVRRLVEVLDLPDGVVNVVVGDGTVGAVLVENPDVRLVVHTGSVESGRRIAEACARRLCPVVLELGGKDPVIVDDGVDVAWAADVVVGGAFVNAGQLCTALERVYVLPGVADAFLEAVVDRARTVVSGPGTDPSVTLGPLIDAQQRSLVHEHVRDAVERGARLLTGGEIPAGPGYFYPPTVLADVDRTMRVMSEETFGPVLPVQTVADLDAAVAEANATAYGLAATVLTARTEGVAAARRIRAGTVWVNAYLVGTPGGVCHPRGVSGLGAVGDRAAVLDAVSVPRVLHLAGGADALDAPPRRA